MMGLRDHIKSQGRQAESRSLNHGHREAQELSELRRGEAGRMQGRIEKTEGEKSDTGSRRDEGKWVSRITRG